MGGIGKTPFPLRNGSADGNAGKALPVNIRRLIWDAQRIFRLDPRNPSDLAPLQICSRVNSLVEHLRESVLPGGRNTKVKGVEAIHMEACDNATLSTVALLKSTFDGKEGIRRILLE